MNHTLGFSGIRDTFDPNIRQPGASKCKLRSGVPGNASRTFDRLLQHEHFVQRDDFHSGERAFSRESIGNLRSEAV